MNVAVVAAVVHVVGEMGSNSLLMQLKFDAENSSCSLNLLIMPRFDATRLIHLVVLALASAKKGGGRTTCYKTFHVHRKLQDWIRTSQAARLMCVIMDDLDFFFLFFVTCFFLVLFEVSARFRIIERLRGPYCISLFLTFVHTF